MSELHFNLQTMPSYRRDKIRRGYNPFDNPEEWEFFAHPFEMDEEDDILTDLLFQIRKMSRRLHLFFDNPDSNRMETAFYFGLLDSLAEAEDYLLGALKYARYCRLEKLFFLSAHEGLGTFLEKLGRLYDELLLKVRSFGESIVELNQECKERDLFLLQYCFLTQHGIPNDMMYALLRAPNFLSDSNDIIIIDKKTNFWSYVQNTKWSVKMVGDEPNIEGACDSSGLEKMLEPVDMLLWNIRGTLLWVVIQKIKWVRINATAIAHRHDKLLETMCKDAYEEILGAYAHSKAYAKMRDEELSQQCVEYMSLQGGKPTVDDMRTYFNTHYRNIILSHNKSQQLFHQYRKQENTFYIEFLNMLLNEDTREDAEDFLFFHTYSKELSDKQTLSEKNRHYSADESSVNSPVQKTESSMKIKTLIVEELIIEGGDHPRFPECLSVDDTKKLYDYLSQNGFISREKTPLADFNYLMGASKQYATPNGPKPICWIINGQMLRQMLLLAFSPLLKNGTSQAYLGKIVPHCFVDEKNKPLKLPKNDERAIDYVKMESLKHFFTTILQPNINSWKSAT